MGHRRVGILPRTAKWREIVALVADAPSDPGQIGAIVSATLDGVRFRFRDIDRDPAVVDSFKFLVALATAAKAEDVTGRLAEQGVRLSGDATPLNLARGLQRWVELSKGSTEYAA